MQSLGASATRQQGVLEKSEAIEQVCTTLPGDATREQDGMSRLWGNSHNRLLHRRASDLTLSHIDNLEQAGPLHPTS